MLINGLPWQMNECKRTYKDKRGWTENEERMGCGSEQRPIGHDGHFFLVFFLCSQFGRQTHIQIVSVTKDLFQRYFNLDNE